jgi:hypothetical protein
LVSIVVTLGVAEAQAHIDLTSHDSRYGRNSIKQGPCGMTGGERSENVYTYAPGETIMLEWEEFIPHPGYFRVSFDDDGDDAFVDPVDYYDYYTNDAVLLDALHQHDQVAFGTIWQQEVTLPDVECDNCTLQVVQVMTDKPPYVIGTNDLYFNCIDLVLDGALREPDAEMDVGADMDAATDADSSGDVGTADGGVQDDTTLPGDAADIDEPGPIGPSTPPDTGCAVSGEAPERGALVLCMLLVGAAALRSPRVRL